MDHFLISKDDKAYQAWPDLTYADGRLVCIFAECNHHGDREWTRISCRTSDDRGRTWSDLISLTPDTYRSQTGWFWNCPRITALEDGRLVAVCDRLVSEDPDAEAPVFLWVSHDKGETWDGPVSTPICGLCPDRLIVSSLDGAKRWHLATHRRLTRSDGVHWVEQTWFSADEGATWEGPFVIADSAKLRFCEGSVFTVPSGELVCLLRENAGLGLDAFKSVSTDGGRTWSEPVAFPIPGCHRPVGGVLQSGHVMVTFRLSQGGKGWLGWWTQNFCLAWMTVESCLAPTRQEACTRIMPLAYDRSPHADIGYSGWVQLPDGEIFVAYYLVDDHDRGHIRGCSLRETDIVLS